MRNKIGWYFARLAAMSPREIGHRMLEYRRKRQLAGLAGGWLSFNCSSPLSLTALRPFKARLAGANVGMVDDVLAKARFLGLERSDLFHVGKSTAADAWFVDPVSGRPWPDQSVPALAINVRATSAQPSAERPYGDVKFVWEPNRLQILHPLAVIAAGDDPEAARARILGLSIINAWMDANPPYRGVNWTSGIELSLRLISVTMFAAALGEENSTGEVQSRLSGFVQAHARMLAALPSLYSSANNHRIAEGVGLFLSGILCPSLHQEGREGRYILETELLLQIFADGVGGEQSPTYQAFTMELAGFSALIGALTGAPFSQALVARLESGAGFLRALQSGDGRVPAIGDDDEGRAICCPHIDEPLYVASVANMVSGLAGKASAEGAQPGYLRERLACSQSHSGTSIDGIKRFDQGGYDIVNTTMSGRRVHLTFDRGPLGYLALAGHGHADALAIWLSVDGLPVFIDAGTWLYHSGEQMRSELRRSQMHNTLSLRDISQSEPSSAFSWANKAQTEVVAPDPALVGSQPTFALAGRHDGYKRRAGVLHRRDIIGNSHGFVVYDRFEGTGDQHDVSIFFLCDPSLTITIQERGLLLSRAECPDVLRLIPPSGFTAKIVGTVQSPLRYSPRFGALRETAGILLEGRLAQQPCATTIQIGTVGPQLAARPQAEQED